MGSIKQHQNSKFTDERKLKILEALSLGCTHELAAKYAGIGESTFYLWLARGREGREEYIDFLEAVKRTEAKCAVGALSIIIGQARGREAKDGKEAIQPKWQAAAWLLERRYSGYSTNDNPSIEINIDSEQVNVDQMITDLRGSKELLERITGPVIDLDE
ncbi:hypothetical protein CL634_09305 [bacterium]|nr:hypothetical protein [bacterium]